MTVNQQTFLPSNILQKLLERIPQLAWLMTERGEILAVNQRWCEYLGESDDRHHLGGFAEILHEAEGDLFSSAWEEASRSQQPLEIKLRLKSRLGNWEWFKLEIEPDRDEVGQTLWIGTAIRLGSEAAIPGRPQSTKFLDALLTCAPDGIVACDADGRLVLFNRMAQVFYGLPPEPLEPEAWASYYDLSNGDGSRTLTKPEIPLFRALAGESVVNQEMTVKPNQGITRSLLANATPIYNSTGEKLGAVALMQDITAYTQAISTLQQSEQKFRAIFDGTFGLIGLLKTDGSIVEMNRTAVKFAGMEDDRHWIGCPLWKAPCWSYSPAVQQQLQESIARAAQGEFIRYEVELMGAGNRLVPIDFSLTPIRNDLGEVILIIPEGRDRTQIEQAETERLRTQLYTDDLQHLNHSLMFAQQQLKDRNEELSSFGYIVSHDLKAPLRAIANLSEWIEEDLSDRILDGDRQQFQLLRQRVKRMDALIDGLLHYSRVGRQELAIETVDVSQLLTETIDALIVPPTFQIQILPPLPTLETKRILLSQILANLLSNAIKHHDRADGRIEITAKDVGDRYQFSIADDGPGIPPGAAKDRIFEIFQTLKPSSSNANTGIGLALAKKIVEGEGGEIWLDETETGARFCFTWRKAEKL